MATATQTFFDPSISLPASVTAIPTAQFTPPPGCIDPDDNFVVHTDCDWLDCTHVVTQFGDPYARVNSCDTRWQATKIDGVVSSFIGCPSGYSTIGVENLSMFSGAEIDHVVSCCPTQYRFTWGSGYTYFPTVRDGTTVRARQWVPYCEATHVEELSGREIAVRTREKLDGWWTTATTDPQEVADTVQWDYERDTIYADGHSGSYTVFYGTHTCFGKVCPYWRDYYFSSSPMPDFTAPPHTWNPSSANGEVGDGDEPTSTPLPTTSSGGPSDESAAIVVATPFRLVVLLGLLASSLALYDL